MGFRTRLVAGGESDAGGDDGIRRRPDYPDGHLLAGAAALFRRAGLTIIADETDDSTTGSPDAEELVSALYLPGLPAARIEAAVRIIAKWQGKGAGIPLRRLIAQAQ